MRPAVVLGTNLLVAAAGLGYLLFRFGRPALALLGAGPSPLLLAAFLGAVAAGLVGYALRWRILLAGLDTPSGLARLTAFRAAGQSVSSLVPSAKLGGEPLRAYLLVHDCVPGAEAIASVAVDRTLEMGASAGFAVLFAVLLVRRGVPALQGALVTVSLAAAALGLGVAVTARRLRRGTGLVTAVARLTGLDRLRVVREQIGVLAGAEEAAGRLLAQPSRLGLAFLVGVAVNVVVLVEYTLLLAAFGLPAGPLAVVAAIFATGAAHTLPVPAAVGALEGAEMFLFGTLGYPPEVGLAVGLAVRLRELVWVSPGLVYLAARGLRRWVAGPTAGAGVSDAPVGSGP